MASRLVDLILNIAESERKVEIVRQVLAEQVLFEPYTAFKRLDQKRKGYISYPEIQEFLDDNQIQYDQIDFLIDKIDKDQDGQISYTDFGHYILPKSTYLKQLANMRESYYIEPNMLLPYEVEWSMARVFSQEILNQKLIQALINSIVKQDDFDLSSLFKLVNSGKSWDINSIKLFFSQQSKTISHEEIQAFLLVADANHDGLIDYRDFLKLFKEHLLNQQQEPKYSTPIKQKQTKSNNEMSTAAKSPDQSEQNALNAFIITMKQLIDFENEINDYKKQLALKSDFSIYSLFYDMDPEEKGYLSQEEFKEALKKFGLELDDKSITLFYKRYCKETNLSFAEFQKAFLCPQNQNLFNKKTNEEYQEISNDSLLLFKKLLLTIIDREDSFEQQKFQFQDNIQDLFELIDSQGNGTLRISIYYLICQGI